MTIKHALEFAGYCTGCLAGAEMAFSGGQGQWQWQPNDGLLGHRFGVMLLFGLGGFTAGEYVAQNGLESAKGVIAGVFLASMIGYPVYRSYCRSQPREYPWSGDDSRKFRL